MRSELDIYSEMTLKRGEFWHRLDKKNGYSLYSSGYTTPVYRIFDANGKRVYTNTNYDATMIEFERLTE